MRDEQTVRMKADGVTLGARSGAENFRGDETAGNPATVEFLDVMQTARRTRSSVGQAFDHHITLARHLLQERDGRRARECGLFEAQYFHAARSE